MIRCLIGLVGITRGNTSWALDKMKVSWEAMYSENDSGVTAASSGGDFEMTVTGDRAAVLDAVAAEVRACAQYGGNNPECFGPYHPTFAVGEILIVPDNEER